MTLVVTINTDGYDPYTGSGGVFKPTSVGGNPPAPPPPPAHARPNEADAVAAGINPVILIVPTTTPGMVTANATGVGVNPTVTGSTNATPRVAPAQALGIKPTVSPVGTIVTTATPLEADATAVGVNPDASSTTPVAFATGVGVTPTVSTNSANVFPTEADATGVGIRPSVGIGGLPTTTASPFAATGTGVGVKPSTSVDVGFGLGPFGEDPFGGTVVGLQGDPFNSINAALAAGGTWDGGGATYLLAGSVLLTTPGTIQNATFVDPYLDKHTAVSGTGDQNGGPYTLTMASVDTVINGFSMPYIIVDGNQTVANGTGINYNLNLVATAVSGLVITFPSVTSPGQVNPGQSIQGDGLKGDWHVNAVSGTNVTIRALASGTGTPVAGGTYQFSGDGEVTVTSLVGNTIGLTFSGSANCDAPLAAGTYRFLHLTQRPGQPLGVHPLVRAIDTSNVTISNITCWGSGNGTGGYHPDEVGQHGFQIQSVNNCLINNCVSQNTCGDGIIFTTSGDVGTPTSVTVNGFATYNAGREGITMASVLGTAANPCVLSDMTVSNPTFGTVIDVEADNAGDLSGYVVFNNLYGGTGGVRMIEPLHGPLTFNNYAPNGCSLAASAAVSGQLITFNGGSMMLQGNPASIQSSLYVEGGGQMVLNNVALVWQPSNKPPGPVAWWVQEPGTSEKYSGPPTQGSKLTLNHCTLAGLPLQQSDGTCLGNGTTDLSVVIINN